MPSSPSNWTPITEPLSSADLQQMMGAENALLQAVINAEPEQKLFTLGDTQRVVLVAGTTIDNATWQVYMA